MQLTVVGQFGVNGIPVVNLAEQVYKNGLGTVRSQRPCITESLVRGNRGKTASAMRMRVLWMAVGAAGACGLGVTESVAEARDNGFVPAQTHRPPLVEKAVVLTTMSPRNVL